FHSDYKDYQVRGLVDVPNSVPLNVLSNAGDARIRGAELAIRWRPVERLTLSFSGSYTDAKLIAVNAGAPFIVGDRLDLVPKYNYNMSAEYDWALGDYEGFIRADYSEQGRSVYQNRTIGPWYFGESDIINLLDIN